MGRRDAVPLHKNNQAKLIDTVQDYNNPHKKVTVHLGLGIGDRASAVCHTHSDWFFYEDDKLYIQIKNEAECRKDSENDACGECRQAGRDHFEAKTEAGNDRIILISNTYTNHAAGGRNGEEQYFGLRDTVEQYFALDLPGAPDDPRVHQGFDMIQCDGKNGLSNRTANTWLREVAAESAIKAPRRKRRLKEELTSGTSYNDEEENEEGDEERAVEEQITDFGRDEDGNQIPDLIFHDLRACYCTQLMRQEVPPNKAINKTGHSDPDSLKPYVMFAANEIDAEEEESWF
jgi:hypothetical protein